jgi:hypothetical protein
MNYNTTRSGNSSTAPKQSFEERKRDMLKKEAKLEAALKTEGGLAKIAATLTNPVRRYLDYVGIVRNFFVVEPIPDGMEIYYDPDIDEFYGTIVGKNGTSVQLILQGERVFVPDWELIVRAKIPWAELHRRKFRILDRARQRLQQALQLSEDLRGFTLWATTTAASGLEVNVATALLPEDLSTAAYYIQRNRLNLYGLVVHPAAIKHARQWTRDHIDEALRIEVRQEGMLGSLWGTQVFVTNIIPVTAAPQTSAFILTTPQFHGWMPMRVDAAIVPADKPDDARIGFVAYELLGMHVHNANSVARVLFNPDVNV